MALILLNIRQSLPSLLLNMKDFTLGKDQLNRSTEKMRHEKCLYEPYGLESPKNGNYKGYLLF